MTYRLYYGPYDTGAPVPAGTNPDWCNPHDPDSNNVAALVISTTAATRTVTINQIMVRNHGDSTADNSVTITLYALVLDAPPGNGLGQADGPASNAMKVNNVITMPANGVIQSTPTSWEMIWPFQTVPGYSANGDNPLRLFANGKVITWQLPKKKSIFVLVATLEFDGTVPAQLPQNTPTTDPCTAVLYGSTQP